MSQVAYVRCKYLKDAKRIDCFVNPKGFRMDTKNYLALNKWMMQTHRGFWIKPPVRKNGGIYVNTGKDYAYKAGKDLNFHLRVTEMASNLLTKLSFDSVSSESKS